MICSLVLRFYLQTFLLFAIFRHNLQVGNIADSK